MTAQLHCFAPEPVAESWVRACSTAERYGGRIQHVRDLLERAWPTARETARQRVRSQIWAAAL